MASREDIEFTKGQSIYYEYPTCYKSIASFVVEAKKKLVSAPYDITDFFSISGDDNDIFILDILDSSFMDDWDQWMYDIRAVDSSGNVVYPFYGLIYKKGGISPKRDRDLP